MFSVGMLLLGQRMMYYVHYVLLCWLLLVVDPQQGGDDPIEHGVHPFRHWHRFQLDHHHRLVVVVLSC